MNIALIKNNKVDNIIVIDETTDGSGSQNGTGGNGGAGSPGYAIIVSYS